MDLNILQKNLNEISLVAKLISQCGWAEGNAGNISYNITNFVKKIFDFKKYKVNKFKKSFPNLKENFILVTATGIKMRELENDVISNTNIIYILKDGKSYITLRFADIFENYQPEYDKELQPTSELPTHLHIHNFLNKYKRKEKFILHTHPTEIIALTQIKEFTKEKNINRLIWKMHPEMKIILPNGIGLVSYCIPGSEKIAELTLKSMKNHNAIIWEKHGCLAVGENIFAAFDIIDTISKSIKIFFLCKSAGYTPEGLKNSDLKNLIKFFPNIK